MTDRSYGRDVLRVKQNVARCGSAGIRLIPALGGHSMSHGKHCQVDTVRDAQLGVHPAEVVLYGLGLQAQAIGDLLVRAPGGNERDDLMFTWGKAYRARREALGAGWGLEPACVIRVRDDGGGDHADNNVAALPIVQPL